MKYRIVRKSLKYELCAIVHDSTNANIIMKWTIHSSDGNIRSLLFESAINATYCSSIHAPHHTTTL